MWDVIASVINLGIAMATPLALASVGEVYSERSGTINLGVEGIMLMGAIAAFHMTYVTGDLMLGYLAGLAIGVIFGMLFSFMSVTLRLNQVIAGMGIYFLGFGLSDFIYKTLYGKEYVTIQKPPQIPVPGLVNIPIIGQALFDQYPTVYLTYILIPVLWYLLYKSSIGISVRAVGENPKAADTMGVNVFLVKHLTIWFGSALAGLAGAALCLEITGLFFENLTFGLGFIAVGLVYFGKWDPMKAWAGALIYGMTWSISVTLQDPLQKMGHPEMVYFMLMLPYIVIIIALVIMSRGARPPKYLGVPYTRE